MLKSEGNIDITKYVESGPLFTEMTKELHNVRTTQEEMMDCEAIEAQLGITVPVGHIDPIPKEGMLYGIQEHVPIVPTEKWPEEQLLIDLRVYKQGRYVKTIQDHQVTEVLPSGLPRYDLRSEVQ